MESKSQDLPTIDEAAIPIQFKTTQDPAPARAPSDRGGTPSDIDKGEARSTLSKARVNTTAFHYLPDLRKLNDTLPNFENSDDEDGEEEKDAKKRRWLDMGLCYPDKESNGQRWYGAHWLGHGATGRVALWVGSNDNNVIQDVSHTFLISASLTCVPEACCERRSGILGGQVDQSYALARSTPTRNRNSSAAQQPQELQSSYPSVLRTSRQLLAAAISRVQRDLRLR